MHTPQTRSYLLTYDKCYLIDFKKKHFNPLIQNRIDKIASDIDKKYKIADINITIIIFVRRTTCHYLLVSQLGDVWQVTLNK